MRKNLCLVLAVCLCAGLIGCGNATIESTVGPVEGMDATPVDLNGDSAKVNGRGASASDAVVTVSAAGYYSFSGQLDNGQIIVDAGDDAGRVTLILNNASISNAADAAIYVRQAKDVTIYMPKDTVNILTSGTEADATAFDESTATGAVIFAEDDIDFDGSGKLSIYGYLNNGVTCKDDINVKGGVIDITAANNGMRGSESVEVKGGELTVTAGNDGIKSTKTDKEGKGFVSVSGGTVNITAACDGISAEKELTVTGGQISINAGTAGADSSGKGLKAVTALTISGGDVSIMSVDHAIHCDAVVSVTGGTLCANSTEGKGVDATGNIEITGGNVAVASVKDGVGSEANITITGGTVSVISAKDSFNAKGLLISTGGAVMGIGNSKRVKSFDASSSQSFIACTISGTGGTTVEIKNGDSVLWTVCPQWSYNTVILASSMLDPGQNCTVSNSATSVDVSVSA